MDIESGECMQRVHTCKSWIAAPRERHAVVQAGGFDGDR
jgi:hypothetical protein